MPEAIREENFLSYVDAALARFERARRLAGETIRRRFYIAGEALEFEFAGQALVSKICPAFEHLEIDLKTDRKADFTVHCWDLASTKVAMPRRPWSDDESFIHGEIPSFVDSNRYLHFNLASGALIVADRAKRSAAFWIRNASDINTYEMAAPFRDFLNWWGSIRGILQVHAGAVGRADRGALLVGRSGAGKSNASLICLQSELKYLADDCCLLDTRNLFIHGIYCSGKIYMKDLPKFPSLEYHSMQGIVTPEDKKLFFLNKILPEKLGAGFPLKVIFLPRLKEGTSSSVAPASSASALLAIAPDNILRWPVVGRDVLSNLARAVRSVPCFHLNMGSDRAQIPVVISSTLDNL